ncbi:hypothetical protein F4861DRAFT_507673 [Xylaria intraflava]|nr:hypothetical protein F4861DRAFT_507673 [Xylaria intraflava]
MDVEDYETNDGYLHRVRWNLRGEPSLDEDRLQQTMQLMDEACQVASLDWPSRQAAIDEQTALDRAVQEEYKKKWQKEAFDKDVAALERRRMVQKKKGPSMFREFFPNFP